MTQTLSFGRAIRHLWLLSENVTFLNHGSFGACPRSVLQEQDRFRTEMEQSPDSFFFEGILPNREETAIRFVAAALGELTGVSHENVALVENATSGTQAVLGSVALGPGDQILITDHQYNAVRLAVEARCKESGATPLVVSIPLRTTAPEIRSRIREAANRSVKLAILDHITSPTAYVFPIREIIADLHALSIPVHVDGAHAVGQIDLDLGALDADWYVSNAHKWLYAPKGSAFLYASPRVAGMTRPTVVSHFTALGFPRAFDYLGTRDNSGWLAIPSAIAFLHELGEERLRHHERAILERAAEILGDLGIEPISSVDMCAAMRTFVLPQARAAQTEDGVLLRETLWNEERIQIHSSQLFDSLVLRISAQAYVDERDVEKLAAALRRRGWPGRTG